MSPRESKTSFNAIYALDHRISIFETRFRTHPIQSEEKSSK